MAVTKGSLNNLLSMGQGNKPLHLPSLVHLAILVASVLVIVTFPRRGVKQLALVVAQAYCANVAAQCIRNNLCLLGQSGGEIAADNAAQGSRFIVSDE